MQNEAVLNLQPKDGDNTRTWAGALKEAASFVKEQAFTFGGKLITPPHERLEFKIEPDHTLSTIYAKESDTYTTVSAEITKFKSEITTLEEKIKGLTEALKTEQSDTDAQEAEKKSLSDAHADLKKAKSSLNKSNMSLWFAAFTNTFAKTPKYSYNLGNNVVNLFLRALGAVINACAFALYAVSYIVLKLRILVAPVTKSDTKNMSEVWDTANEKTSYAAVVYAYLTYKMPSENVGSGEKPGEKPIAAETLTNAATPVKLYSKKSKNNSDLTEIVDEDKDLSSTLINSNK